MFFLNQYKEQVYYQTINLRQFVHYFWNVFFLLHMKSQREFWEYVERRE